MASTKKAVPLLPGYGYGQDMTQKNHFRKQSWSYGPGGAMDALKPTPRGEPGQAVPTLDFGALKAMLAPAGRYNVDKEPPTHDERQHMKDSAKNTYRPALAPAWLKHDRQVLRYNAYFQEPVHESPNENFRIRRCTVLFYLEDGSMQIVEQKMENSGIPQGVLVKRHRIPKVDRGYYEAGDLRCGEEISVYAKIFKICDADEFTRWFYQHRLFMELGESVDFPVDAFQAMKQANSGGPKAAGGSLSLNTARSEGIPKEVAEGKEFAELSLGGNRRNARLQQFLENDRRVLRFSCFWDDPTRYGARQYYTLHYFLADDTVEILEIQARNTGRDPYPVFCRRAPLRKNPIFNATPGMLEPDAVLYKPEDLMVGEYVTVFGREIFIYACDDFTREFYMNWKNIAQPEYEIEEPTPVHHVLSHPPHAGLGSEEDSLASCKLRPKPPRKDLKRLMGYSDKVMRFEATIHNGQAEDRNRKFVVAIYMADETVAVWEARSRNSGHTEGKFAERSKKRGASGAWLTCKDFVVGDVVTINATPFRLLRADEATQKLMELHAEELK